MLSLSYSFSHPLITFINVTTRNWISSKLWPAVTKLQQFQFVYYLTHSVLKVTPGESLNSCLNLKRLKLSEENGFLGSAPGTLALCSSEPIASIAKSPHEILKVHASSPFYPCTHLCPSPQESVFNLAWNLNLNFTLSLNRLSWVEKPSESLPYSKLLGKMWDLAMTFLQVSCVSWPIPLVSCGLCR